MLCYSKCNQGRCLFSKACLRGGGGPQVGEVTRLGRNPPVHIISHLM